MKSGRGEMYSLYLTYFVNSIRFGLTKLLIHIRKPSKKFDIDEIALNQNHRPYGQKMITKC